MSRFRLLKLPTEHFHEPVSVDRLRRQIRTPVERMIQSPELVRTLAHLPRSEGYGLAEEIMQCLTARLADLGLPEGFPTHGERKLSYQKQSAAWLELAQVYVAWLHQAEGKPAGRLLADALFCLRRVIVIAGICHWPLLKGLWADVHRLYRLGRERQSVRQPGLLRRFDGMMVGVEEAYIHLLMLGLIDLSGLRPVEVCWLDRLLEKWAALVALVEDAKPGWGIDGRTDQAAVWGEGRLRVRLDFSRLRALLDDQCPLAGRSGRFQPGLSDRTIDLELLQLWRRQWETAPDPMAGRVLTGGGDLVLGFKGIFQRLRGGRVPGLPVKPLDGWIRVPGEGVQIGDLAGLFEPGGSRMRALAVVDRLYAAGLEGAGINLQFRTLARRVCAVGLQPLHGRFQTCQPALLLEEEGDLRLMLQEQPLPEDTVVRLLHGSAVYPVRLYRRRYPALGVMSLSCTGAASSLQK